MRRCHQCVHHVHSTITGEHLCARALEDPRYVNHVTGAPRPRRIRYIRCDQQRRRGRLWAFLVAQCGSTGRYFVEIS